MVTPCLNFLILYILFKKQKDKGLMKAVKEQPQFRLTSNFTFRTMQKVEEAILLREKKQG